MRSLVPYLQTYLAEYPIVDKLTDHTLALGACHTCQLHTKSYSTIGVAT